jgi:5'-nucleotidase
MLSRNDPVSGLRVFRSAQHYGLSVQRGVFTRGQPPWRYLMPLRANLFLSANEADVRAALAAGVPAARVYPHAARASDAHPQEVRIAFDGDAVLFGDEAERVFQSQGLDAFHAHETAHAARPLAAGPFKPLLQALQRLQREPAQAMRIRTALVTARSAPAHERAMRTLMDWHIEVDEAMFLGGLAMWPRPPPMCRPGTWPRASATPDQDWPKPRRRSRSSTRTPPYSTLIRLAACSACSASLTRCRDRPTR